MIKSCRSGYFNCPRTWLVRWPRRFRPARWYYLNHRFCPRLWGWNVFVSISPDTRVTGPSLVFDQKPCVGQSCKLVLDRASCKTCFLHQVKRCHPFGCFFDGFKNDVKRLFFHGRKKTRCLGGSKEFILQNVDRDAMRTAPQCLALTVAYGFFCKRITFSRSPLPCVPAV